MKQILHLVILAALAFSPAALAQKTAERSRLVPDKGKLRIVVDGQTVGTEDFQISGAGAEWTSRAEVQVQLPGAKATKLTSNLRLGAQDRPVQYEWSLDSDKKIGGKVVFEGGNASVELKQEGAAPYTQMHMFGEQRVVILDNNFYHHFGILGRLYDWDKKGEQQFSVYVPQEMVPGTAIVASAGSQEVDGAKYDVLRLRTDDLDMYLFFDKQRLMRITVPGSNVMVIRE